MAVNQAPLMKTIYNALTSLATTCVNSGKTSPTRRSLKPRGCVFYERALYFQNKVNTFQDKKDNYLKAYNQALLEAFKQSV